MIKTKRKPSITLIVIASLLLLLGLWHTVRMMAVKYWMEDYLKKEYGKEFVVNKVGYQFSYYGDGLYLKGIAHPKDDPSLKFDIVRDSSGGIFRKYLSPYGESYIIDLWEKQKREEIKTVLRSNLVLAGIWAPYKKEELYGRTISIKEAEQQFKNRMKLYITYGLLINTDDFNRKIDEFDNFKKGNLSRKQAEDLFDIIKKVKNQNYKRIILEVRYFNSKFEKKVDENPEHYLYGKVSYYEGLSSFENGTVLCLFEIDDINRINKPEDVARFIDLKAGYLYCDNSKD
jgi:hypothetical protein